MISYFEVLLKTTQAGGLCEDQRSKRSKILENDHNMENLN